MDSSNPSRFALPYRPRDYVSIFIHTLHLLDLDLLPDFPAALTESTLRSSAKVAPSNLQQRVKCVEWALYRLFEMYDPVETREKLQPHFPPSTPKDSLNLRAALYRSLTELKKNAALSRETVLRKTMLDECKGDKFEEMLASFGMLVLRKKADAHRLHSGVGVKATHNGLQNVGTEQIVPIMLAHRVSLRNTLQRRQTLKRSAAAQMDEIRQLREAIAARTALVSQNALPDEELGEDEYDALKDRLNRAFAMDRRWVTFLLEGTTAPRLGLSSSTATAAGTESPWQQQALTLAFEMVDNTAHHDDNNDDDDDDDDDTDNGDKHKNNSASEHDAAGVANEPMTQLLRSLDDRRSHIQHLKRLRDTIQRPSAPAETETETVSLQQFQTATQAETRHDHPASTSANRKKAMRFSRHQGLNLVA
ncbi:hypothetical protein PV08_00325 [Exophiala spinifera]|uniref:HAUS augmin-like complex subunit 6 N-terminal domain-containing protein n=1 Tax=Exophiala spinifera TaxID=91928 RepID=A0A0D1YWR5_9EURO|nr:uncharacterized protein PV08_00325 [Exophiala spinifera]KIW19751.1 hypothetical protein PV08_00325 [Exophiala spinifera]